MQAPDQPSPAGRGQAEAVDLAESAWAIMSGFVRRFDPAEELRRALGLGRGSGRVKTLLGLADGPLSVAQLADAVGADPPYMTLIVNELQALGLVERAPDEHDKRRKQVTLTEPGRETVEAARRIMARPPGPLVLLGPQDLAELRRILERLPPQETDRQPNGIA